MRYPAFLKENGAIGFVAPSFGCNIEPYRTAFDNALRRFREKGHRTVLGANCYAGEGTGISNTPEACAKELTEAYLSEESDVLISCGGGELMCGILEHMDFTAIGNAPPKWFMGYSDNTNFTFPLTVLTDTASIYAPCASAFGMEPWHEAIADAYALLCGKKLRFTGYAAFERESEKDEARPLAPYHATEPSVKRCFIGRRETGELWRRVRILCGCLDCLQLHVGTKYDRVKEFAERYREDGILWFMEACDLTPMGVRRALWQLENAGWFSHVRGFVFGRPMRYGEEMLGLSHTEAVLGILGKYGLPVLLDADIGHLPPAVPVICGSMAEVTAREGGWELEMSLR